MAISSTAFAAKRSKLAAYRAETEDREAEFEAELSRGTVGVAI